MARGLTRRELGKAAIAGAALAGLGGAAGLAGCGSSGDSTTASKQDVISRLPDFGVPRPVDYVRSNWSRDPLAFCSYSYLAPTRYGSEVRLMLAEPVGRIAFAGEATAPIPATVHGAISAGRDASGIAASELSSGSRVAVVGAGAAGLACAGALLERGFEPVVLEASDRIGGRVRSADLDGSPVELGASWIHGVDGNPLVSLADDAGVGLHRFAYDSEFPIPGQQSMVEAGEIRFNRSINSFSPKARGASEVTLDQLLPWRWGPGLEWVVQTEVQQEYGADPGQLAALATWEGDWLTGGDALLDGPYVDLLARLPGEAEIRFGTRVNRISQDARGVDVEWNGGEVRVDAAVITVPIGVLKAGIIDFTPTLPTRTRIAINALGAGLLDKLWLAFDEPFWDEQAEGFAWIDPRLPGRWGSWVNAIPVTGQPFLLTLSGGSDARRLAARSDLDLVAGAMRALDAMFG